MEDAILAEWEAYVHSFNRKTVHLMMIAVSSDNKKANEELGEFPIQMFSHLKLTEGLLLNVKVMSSDQISIITVKPTLSKVSNKISSLLKNLT